MDGVDGAVVLSGGASSRMGRDKAWLELGGRPLLAHVVAEIAGRCRVIEIAARVGQELPDLSFAAALAQVERVDDPIPDGGPLVGVLAGLERLAALGVERAYLGSCDAAAVRTRHVAFMLERLAAPRPGAPSAVALVPMDAEGRVHPLASAVVVDAMLARARAQLSRQDLRLRALFHGPQIETVAARELPDPGVLAPCNTPEEWAALRDSRS